jgi:hypothetical protein
MLLLPLQDNVFFTCLHRYDAMTGVHWSDLLDSAVEMYPLLFDINY